MENGNLFTIGHSTLSSVFFVNLLKAQGCQTVCDVRSWPYSLYNKQFNKNNISQELSNQGIKYVFCGEALGGRSPDSSHYIDGRLQYQLLSKSERFQTGLQNLTVTAKTGHLALMCAEKDPLQCHRMILVCREICRQKIFPKNRIYHILSDNSVKTHTEMEEFLLKKLKIHVDFFKTRKECIEEAYNKQAKKIAYSHKDSVIKKPNRDIKSNHSNQLELF